MHNRTSLQTTQDLLYYKEADGNAHLEERHHDGQGQLRDVLPPACAQQILNTPHSFKAFGTFIPVLSTHVSQPAYHMMSCLRFCRLAL